MSLDTKCCTRPTAARRQPKLCGKPKPRPSHLSWAKQSDSRPAPLPPTTSSFTTATLHCWRKALKLAVPKVPADAERALWCRLKRGFRELEGSQGQPHKRNHCYAGCYKAESRTKNAT